MINTRTGVWTPEPDYSNFPEDQMCDYDYVARFILESGYQPQTSLENLVFMVVVNYDADMHCEPKLADNLMINTETLALYIEIEGGLSEFDYEC